MREGDDSLCPICGRYLEVIKDENTGLTTAFRCDKHGTFPAKYPCKPIIPKDWYYD